MKPKHLSRCGTALILAMFAPGTGSSEELAVANAAAAVEPTLTQAVDAGQALYMKNCRVCHGSKGTAGVPLSGNPKVEGGSGYLVHAILTGPGYMPAFAEALSDDEIAGIATYILNSWGNDYGPVTPEEVNYMR